MPSPWTYVCKNGTCVKKLRSDSTVIQSLDTCRLRCGRFRAIWPRPTGNNHQNILLTTIKSYTLYKISSYTIRLGELAKVELPLSSNIIKVHDFVEAKRILASNTS